MYTTYNTTGCGVRHSFSRRAGLCGVHYYDYFVVDLQILRILWQEQMGY